MLLPAEYLGGAITCDAYHMTDPRADGLGVSTCIELAMKDAGIEKEQVRMLPLLPCICMDACYRPLVILIRLQSLLFGIAK